MTPPPVLVYRLVVPSSNETRVATPPGNAMSMTAPHTGCSSDAKNPRSSGAACRIWPRKLGGSSSCRRLNRGLIGSFRVVRLLEDGDRLLDGPAGTGQALLVHRQLGAPGIDRFAQADDRQIGQLLGDALQAAPDFVELTGHRWPQRSVRTDGGHRAPQLADAGCILGWRWRRPAHLFAG